MKVRTTLGRVLIHRPEHARHTWPMCGCRLRLARSACLYRSLIAQLTVGVSSVSTLAIRFSQKLVLEIGAATV